MSSDTKTERMGLAAEKLIEAGYTSKALELLREHGAYCVVASCGGAEAEYPHANTRREAAEEYVSDGSWGDPREATTWVQIKTWPRWTLGPAILDCRDRVLAVKVAIDPEEPECAEGQEHAWDDHGHDRNHGAGIITQSRCRYCGAVRTTDTYAQDPEDGEQGLTSVSYDLDDHDTSGPADESAKPDSESDYEAVASYVSTFPDDQHPTGEGAADVTVGVASAGEGWRERWYVRTWDDAGGSDEADDTAYETEAEAIAAAEELAAAMDEGDGTADAEDYSARKLTEAAGEPDPRGEWCVWWGTVGDDAHVVARYATGEAAIAAAAIANEKLHAQHPGGHLLCGHEVRCLVDGQWVEADEDGEA